VTDGPTPRDTPDATPTRPLSDAELAVGRAQIGRYKIDRVLGRGGMGIVVEAHDPELDRKVAVKILMDHARSPEALGTAVRREAQALAKVTHGNVLSVYDAGVDGSPFLVMQLVEGETLGAYLARTRPPPAEIIALFLQAARGLAAIHAAGLVHRDVKPSNALVDRSGVVRVSDLGLARIGELAQGPITPTVGGDQTRSAIAGTPAYMAPEQWERMDLTAAADQFSFCVALWEALFGARPYIDMSAPKGEPPEVDASRISKQQYAALRRGLSIDPADRWPSMDALIAALAPPRSKKPLVFGGAVVLAAGATIAAFVAMGGDHDEPPPAPPAVTPVVRPAVLELSDARRLTMTDACDAYPSIAPDGTIYYDQIVGPDDHLFAYDPKTRQSRELTQTRGWDLAPAVSPDGTKLAWLRRTEEAMALVVADVADLSGAKKLANGGLRPAWSPDGTHVWAGARKRVGRMNIATGKAERVLDLPEGAYPMALVELPDGRVVVLTRTGSATADGLAIYAPGATTSTWLLPASDENPMDEVLTLSPSGDAVLVARYTITQALEIWSVPLDGKPPAVVATSIDARKKLVLQGKRLVWSDCTEYMTIAAMEQTPAGGTKFVDVARNKWQDGFPLAIPGTNELVFISYRSGTGEVWRMSRGGENARTVAFGGHELDRLTAVSHDGRLLAGVLGVGLYVGPLDGTAKPQLIVPGAAMNTERNATFSRDNRTVFFESRDGEVDRIASVRVTGGAPAWVLPAGSLMPAQSPTADVLAYLTDAKNGNHLERFVMLLDQKTGKTRKASPDLAAYPYRDLRWSPDGAKLLAVRRDGKLTELDVATGKVLRTFDVGSDTLTGATYAGDEILVGRATSAGDLWQADLK